MTPNELYALRKQWLLERFKRSKFPTARITDQEAQSLQIGSADELRAIINILVPTVVFHDSDLKAITLAALAIPDHSGDTHDRSQARRFKEVATRLDLPEGHSVDQYWHAVADHLSRIFDVAAICVELRRYRDAPESSTAQALAAVQVVRAALNAEQITKR